MSETYTMTDVIQNKKNSHQNQYNDYIELSDIKTSLNDDQKSRLCRLALDLCLSSSYRIEIKELTRLMIKLADKEFTKELIELTQNLSIIVKNKSERMLGIIRHHRKDLFEN